MRHRNTQGLFRDGGPYPPDPAVIGGYANPNQSLPTGRGKFRFISYEPNLSDSFETHDADDLLDRIFCIFGPVNIIRSFGDSWSVENVTEKHGEIRTVFECLDNVKNVDENDDVFVSKNGQSQKAATYGDLL